MQKRGLAIVALVCMSSPTLAADPSGDWFVAERTAVIRIETCGDAMCGTIAWTRDPGIDDKNPDPTKRNRPIVGVTILLGMKPTGEHRWNGDVYNPENGKTYVSHMILMDTNVLRIEGCILGGLICGGEHWARARCETPNKRIAGSGKSTPKGAISCRVEGP